MSDYDIGKAFEEIENELIDSMMRNFSRHRAEETKEGYNWTQWQAEQLKALEEYRKTNAQKFSKQFKSINSKVEEMIHTARADGNAEQEVKILEAIKNGFTPHMPTGASTGEFFKVNNCKLNALVKSTTDDLKRAETAVLRMSNDKYRKAIFNAQVYANTGAGTYEKVVDMACKDMLNAGLNCVEYKNGARHTLSDYADMAIKTANKRAYLRGEGEERAKYGLSLVVVNSRRGGCPDCAKYIGKVFIDDVYSNGKKSDGDYPLLSTAIAEGLFHPRCKDSTSTHYPELDDLSGPLSDDELAELDRQRGLEVQQQHAEKQAERFDRRAKYSLDEDNKRIAQTRANEWHDRADKLAEKVKNAESNSSENVAKSVDYMSHSFRPKFADTKGITFNGKDIAVKKVKNSSFDIITDVDNTRRNKAVRLTEKLLNTVSDNLPVGMELPQIAVVDFEKHNFGIDAIGGYDNATGILYLNSKYDTVDKVLDYINKQEGMFANKTEYAPLLHELGHKYYYDSIKSLAKAKNIEYNEAKDLVDNKIADYIHDKTISKDLKSLISKYAQAGYDRHKYTEIIAESFTVSKNKVANDLMNLVGE